MLQGATIRRDDATGAVIVARIMRGGAADRSGNLILQFFSLGVTMGHVVRTFKSGHHTEMLDYFQDFLISENTHFYLYHNPFLTATDKIGADVTISSNPSH